MRFLPYFLMAILFLALAPAASRAQGLGQTPRASQQTSQSGDDDDYPKTLQETLAKQRIERDKKEFQELVDRSEQAVKISDDLEKSVESQRTLTAEDQRQLERLEKLVKKIRSELGADGEGEGEDIADDAKPAPPADLVTAVRALQSNASRLLGEVKKSTRYSVSVVSVQTSNALLRLVRFIRTAR